MMSQLLLCKDAESMDVSMNLCNDPQLSVKANIIKLQHGGAHFLTPTQLITTHNLKICRQMLVGVFWQLHFRACPSSISVSIILCHIVYLTSDEIVALWPYGYTYKVFKKIRFKFMSFDLRCIRVAFVLKICLEIGLIES